MVVLEGTTKEQIYYEDTDFTGFVYHANYLKYFDRAREILVGIDALRDLHGRSGAHFVVVNIDIRYLAPARFGDLLTIKSRTEITRSPKHTYTHDAYVGDQLITSARVDLVAVDQAGKPRRIPESELQELAHLQQLRAQKGLAKP